jgi:hypothetical protein
MWNITPWTIYVRLFICIERRCFFLKKGINSTKKREVYVCKNLLCVSRYSFEILCAYSIIKVKNNNTKTTRELRFKRISQELGGSYSLEIPIVELLLIVFSPSNQRADALPFN